MNALAQLDRQFVWHPFTQMRDWMKQEPLVIVRGRGAVLEDARGRQYLDANSSIWTNLHGHNHPAINQAIRGQLDKIAHCSALGLANEPASLLAKELVIAAALHSSPQSAIRHPPLTRVFFSDDGSTAVEVALKLAFEYARRSGRCRKPRFLSLTGAYHGDTIGAVSLGHLPLFHQTWRRLRFKTDQVMAPYCYRCPFNRARPERADARTYRQCRWECVDQVEQACARQSRKGEPYAGFVFEPLMQGAAGMIAQPEGWLRRVAGIVRHDGTLLIADEVMTAFGRVGQASRRSATPQTTRGAARAGRCGLLACHLEGVQPDLAALAKGLTGGYLPMAATLTTPAIFDAFLGEYHECKTFFHGHSFTGNPLGAAAGLANLRLLARAATQARQLELETTLRKALQILWSLPNVGDIRQAGLTAGIELVRDWGTREAFALREQVGLRVCEAMARRGVLTRPIGNVIVLMPPYCTRRAQVEQMVFALADSVNEVLGS